MGEPGPVCVIYNPAAGRGRARRAVAEFASANVRLIPTSAPGHATELAQAAAEDGYAVVIAAGGDGTVHEVANGVLRAERPDVIFSVWPIGSANDYAFTLGLLAWWLGRRTEPLETFAADVGVVTGGGRSRYFVNGLGLGFNGAVTLESRKISWLRGVPLYALATLKAVWRHWRAIPMRLTFDDDVRDTPTLALTVNLAQREGHFPLTPHARLDDGLFDVVHAGALTRWKMLQCLPGMVTGRLPKSHPLIRMFRCRRVAVEAAEPLRAHVDGEFFCQPEDGVRELRVELLPGRLRVHTFPPGRVQFPP